MMLLQVNAYSLGIVALAVTLAGHIIAGYYGKGSLANWHTVALIVLALALILGKS